MVEVGDIMTRDNSQKGRGVRCFYGGPVTAKGKGDREKVLRGILPRYLCSCMVVAEKVGAFR